MFLCVWKGLSIDEGGVSRDTVFQETRPGAGFETGGFRYRKVGGATVERLTTHVCMKIRIIVVSLSSIFHHPPKDKQLVRGRFPSTSATTNSPPLAVESPGRLGKEGSDPIDQIAASRVGGTDGSPGPQNDACNKRLFQIFSVTTQVAISRRAHRYILAQRDRPPARGIEEEARGLRPMTWGGNVDED